MLNIFDIQRGSFHDGPGIRTVVFLKGCNLSCLWCQNPESVMAFPVILYYMDNCIGCGQCVQVCPVGSHWMKENIHHFDRKKCIACGKCAEACPCAALQILGQWMREEDIIAQVLRDEMLYEISGGGLTLSGGEPLLQPEGSARLLQLAKENGIHTAIETAGNVKWEVIDGMIPFLDLIIMDIKTTDEMQHKRCCGASNQNILSNLDKLMERKFPVWIRTPIISGVNDNANIILSIVERLKEGNVQRYELLPFHKLGVGKYRALNQKYAAESYELPKKKKIDSLKRIIIDCGLDTNLD